MISITNQKIFSKCPIYSEHVYGRIFWEEPHHTHVVYIRAPRYLHRIDPDFSIIFRFAIDVPPRHVRSQEVDEGWVQNNSAFSRLVCGWLKNDLGHERLLVCPDRRWRVQTPTGSCWILDYLSFKKMQENMYWYQNKIVFPLILRKLKHVNKT